MNKEEALDILKCKNIVEWKIYLEAVCVAVDFFIDSNEETKDNIENELSLDDIYKMDGHPAYFKFGDGTCGWAIIETGSMITLYGPNFDYNMYPDDDFYNLVYNDKDGHHNLHKLGWKAFRRKPNS